MGFVISYRLLIISYIASILLSSKLSNKSKKPSSGAPPINNFFFGILILQKYNIIKIDIIYK
jgi:hypothetical protein